MSRFDVSLTRSQIFRSQLREPIITATGKKKIQDCDVMFWPVDCNNGERGGKRCVASALGWCHAGIQHQHDSHTERDWPSVDKFMGRVIAGDSSWNDLIRYSPLEEASSPQPAIHSAITSQTPSEVRPQSRESAEKVDRGKKRGKMVWHARVFDVPMQFGTFSDMPSAHVFLIMSHAHRLCSNRRTGTLTRSQLRSRDMPTTDGRINLTRCASVTIWVGEPAVYGDEAECHIQKHHGDCV